MLYARKNAAPVTAIESLVNYPANLNIDSVPGQDFVIYLDPAIPGVGSDPGDRDRRRIGEV